MGYSFDLAARDLLYAPAYRLDSTYHGLCYISRGAMAGNVTQWSSMRDRSDDPSHHEQTQYTIHLKMFYANISAISKGAEEEKEQAHAQSSSYNIIFIVLFSFIFCIRCY